MDGCGVDMVDIFTLEMGDPLVPLGVIGELAAKVVIGDPLVPSEISRELLVMMSEGPMVPLIQLEASRDPFVIVTGGPLVPLKVPLDASRDLFVVVTEGPLVPLKVSRWLAAMVPPVISGGPRVCVAETVGLLVSVEVSWTVVDSLVETSWEIVGLDTGGPLLIVVKVSGLDSSVIS